MTITQLKYVLSVSKHKNFTIAAEHSFVTQPTLSMQIQKLEDELGVMIFHRSKKPIELTDIGEKIVEQAKVIVNESNRIEDIVHQHKGFIGGEFRLGIIPTVISTLLPMFLNHFSKTYPRVKLIIEELNTEEIIKKLSESEIHAGLAATPLEYEDIKEKPLYYEPFVGLVPMNHRLFNQKEITPEELEIEDLLLLEEGHCFKQSVINLCKRLNSDNKRNFQLESGNFSTLIKLSKNGHGMTLIPYLQSQDLSIDDQKFLRQFRTPPPAREISLIYHKSQLKIEIIEALKNTIDDVIRGAITIQDVKIISPLKKNR